MVPKTNNSLKIITQNIRSINRNISEFEILMERLNVDLDIIVLTECWITDSSFIPNLDGYSTFKTKCHAKQNDGVVLYIKANLSFTVEEPSFQEGNCLVAIKDNVIAIISIYRSPSYQNIDTFLRSLDLVLQKLDFCQTVILIGDINIDIKDTDQINNKYLTLTAFYGLFPAHTLITREDSGTCLDHIFIKTSYSSTTIVPQTRITDHNPVLIYINMKLDRLYAITKYKKHNMPKINNELLKIDLKPVFASSDPNFCMEYLTNSIATIITDNTTTITLSSRKKIIKPWITPGLLRCIRNKDKLHKKFKLFPNNLILEATYKRYRNFCNKLLKKIKITYDTNLINNVKHDNKKLWSVIKNKINKPNQDKNDAINLLKSSSSKITTLNSINRYFIDRCRQDIGRQIS